MKAIGIILAGGNNRMMRELSNKRAIAAMPIAGSYRAIDFALSNMTNSRIQKVAVITQYKKPPPACLVRYRKQSVSPVILLSIVLHSEPYPQSVKCEVF